MHLAYVRIFIPLIVIMIFLNSPYSNSYGISKELVGNDQNSNRNTSRELELAPSVLSVYTDKMRYGPGEIVTVFGNEFDRSRNPLNMKVDIQVIFPTYPVR